MQWQKEKGQTMQWQKEKGQKTKHDPTLHRKLKIQQHETHK
jgi:hypothetical protein